MVFECSVTIRFSFSAVLCQARGCTLAQNLMHGIKEVIETEKKSWVVEISTWEVGICRSRSLTDADMQQQYVSVPWIDPSKCAYSAVHSLRERETHFLFRHKDTLRLASFEFTGPAGSAPGWRQSGWCSLPLGATAALMLLRQLLLLLHEGNPVAHHLAALFPSSVSVARLIIVCLTTMSSLAGATHSLGVSSACLVSRSSRCRTSFGRSADVSDCSTIVRRTWKLRKGRVMCIVIGGRRLCKAVLLLWMIEGEQTLMRFASVLSRSQAHSIDLPFAI